MSYFPENVFVEIYTAPNGVPTWTNIAGAIVSAIKVNTGFTDGKPLSRLADAGDMRFDLNNITSAYDPSSTFYKGQKIRLRVKYGSLSKVKFFGYIDTINLDPGTWGNRRAHVTCIDWLGLAAKTPIRALAGMTNTTIDLAVAALVAQMQIQPEATDYEIGTVTLPSVFDQVTPNSTVYSELQNLVMGEFGYIYMRDGGMTLKVENALSRTGDGSDYKTTSYYLNDGVAENFLLEDGDDFLLEDGDNFLLEGEPTSESFTPNMGLTYTNININHGDNLTNKISASAVPTIVGGSTVVLYPFDIASGSKAFLIPTNDSTTPFIMQGQYKDPTAGGSQISGTSMQTPVINTDFKFNSKADGTGSDLSGNLTIIWTLGQTGWKASVVNSGVAGYVTKNNIKGTPVYRYSPVEIVAQDQRSIWDYGEYSLQFTRQYGQSNDDVQPYIFRLLMRDRKPRTIASNPKFNAFDTLDHLAGFLCLDIGDQIRLTSTKPANDNLYYIQGCKFTIQPGSELITFDYVTTETLAGSLPSITEIAIDHDDISISPLINFGYLRTVTNHIQRSIVARVYPIAGTGIPSPTRGLFDIVGCWNVYLQYSGGVFAINLTIWNGQTNIGWWAQTANKMSADVWHDIAVTYDGSNANNDPLFYVDSALVSLAELTAPTLPLTDETGRDLILGNYNENNYPVAVYTPPFVGKYESIGVYNRILKAAEISTIHNSGTRLPMSSYPQNGLKFFFGGMDNDAYASKLNGTLISSDTIYELQNGFVGRAIGNPILRAVG